MSTFIWSILIILQSASFTWWSRARNSTSYVYHGLACIVSNLIWFCSQFILVDKFVEARTKPMNELVWLGFIYISCFTFGGLVAHYFLMNHIENGNRKVGQ